MFFSNMSQQKVQFNAPLRMLTAPFILLFEGTRIWLASWEILNIACGIMGLLIIHFIGRLCIILPIELVLHAGYPQGRAIIELRARLRAARNYNQWYELQQRRDRLEREDEWIESDSVEGVDLAALAQHIEDMKYARSTNNPVEMAFLLRVGLHRNFCGLRNPVLYAHSFIKTKPIVTEFYAETIETLRALDACVRFDTHQPESSIYIKKYISLLSDLRLSIGRTAFCLSGGGGLAVYHLGVIKSLLEHALLPNVVSGTSGGSIIAALLATKRDDELLDIVNNPSLFLNNSSLTPPLLKQFRSFICTGYLIDQQNFCDFIRGIIGDYTFSEAFKRTGRFVSITTTQASSRAYGDPLVCNVINTPSVLVWSAVVASCSLPLVLPPMVLYVKVDDNEESRGEEVRNPGFISRCLDTIRSDDPDSSLPQRTEKKIGAESEDEESGEGQAEAFCPIPADCASNLTAPNVDSKLHAEETIKEDDRDGGPEKVSGPPVGRGFWFSEETRKSDEVHSAKHMDVLPDPPVDSKTSAPAHSLRGLVEYFMGNPSEISFKRLFQRQIFKKQPKPEDNGGCQCESCRTTFNTQFIDEQATDGNHCVVVHKLKEEWSSPNSNISLLPTVWFGRSLLRKRSEEKHSNELPYQKPSSVGMRLYAPADMRFVDGSILQDIPHNELQTLFNVKSFLVSQVNPHFTPFVQDPTGYKEQNKWYMTLLDKIWDYFSVDLRNRYVRLLILSFVPSIRGQDISPFLIQSGEGHCTIVPASPVNFWRLTKNPSDADITRAISEGSAKTWPYLERIRHMLCIERELKSAWQRRSTELRSLGISM